MDEYAAAFGWRAWPFRIVVDTEFAKIWADRSSVKSDILKRLRRLRSLPHSTIQMLWADFGAGKSHTLRHLEMLCAQSVPQTFFPVYTEIPVQVEGLSGLYQRFVSTISPALIASLSADVLRSSGEQAITVGARDLFQALRLLASHDANARFAAGDWFRGVKGSPHLTALRACGISGRIEGDDRIVDVISALIGLIRTRYPNGLMWLVDEFQRTSQLPARKRDALMKGLVSLFNACPAGFHVVLSFSVAQKENASDFVPQDLLSRAGTFPMLTLPFLTRADCEAFLVDLFREFRAEHIESQSYPFTPTGLTAVIEYLEARTQTGMTPRKLMEGLGAFLFELYDRSDGQMDLPITKEQVFKETTRASEFG